MGGNRVTEDFGAARNGRQLIVLVLAGQAALLVHSQTSAPKKNLTKKKKENPPIDGHFRSVKKKVFSLNPFRPREPFFFTRWLLVDLLTHRN